MLNLQTGLFEDATHKPSPNHDERPEGMTPDLIVLHAISLPPEQYEGDAVSDYFLNKLDPNAHPFFKTIYQTRVSAHLYIRRSGALIQFVPLHLRAWHAGVSQYQGREGCNDFSIGIELEGALTEPFEAEQYQTLCDVLREMMKGYDIPSGAVVGHEHIAPGRKQDPGPCFDWSQLSEFMEKPPNVELCI